MSSTTTNNESPFGIFGRPRPRNEIELAPVDLATWHESPHWSHPFSMGCLPYAASHPWPYRFLNRDNVWVRASDDEWYRGIITGQPKQGRTRRGQGLWWCVEFLMTSARIRKWFAPLNGDVKPDTPHTHELLRNDGCLIEFSR